MKFIKALAMMFLIAVAFSAFLTALAKHPVLFAVIAICSFFAWRLYTSIMDAPKQVSIRKYKTWE